MTRNKAILTAGLKWNVGRVGALGRQVGYAKLRHKDVVKRYEVGYWTLVSLSPKRWVERRLGNGASWEQAFEEAQVTEVCDMAAAANLDGKHGEWP